ncbi:MAG: hypothetical protein M3367_19080 [Acidobacteriota bacterium]|nr:hypothetical protein [Acidobacteriota bacterium]
MSDNEASRTVGWYLLRYWCHNPRFVADSEKAKIEWKTNRNLYLEK